MMTAPTTLSLPLTAQAGAARWQDYLALLKPRVMSLVVFTALTGLVCAPAGAGGAPLNPILGGVAILCIAVGAGASGALNMWYDADIDALMARTRRRPLPAGRIQRGDALTLGVVLSLFSVTLMGLVTNLLAAGLLAFTIAFYFGVYTVWLKRRTPQNIVIGGLAGALPPLVGWTAASGRIEANALLLVAMIFVWTPPHFWALSLYNQDDYARAGVPMMPVVKGGASTRRQILLYSFVLVPLCLAPALTGLGGAVYLAVAGAGGAIFLTFAIRLAISQAGDPDRVGSTPSSAPARAMFGFSILYLFALFAALLGEHVARALLAP